MKKILLLIVMCISFSVPGFAGDGDKFFSISTGWQYRRTVSTTIAIEFEGRHHNAWELYADLATTYKTCDGCNKICKDAFFDYKTWGIGLARKTVISRGKNSLLRLRLGGDLGTNPKGFQCSLEAGLEWSYSFKNNMQFFVQQKNDFIFWNRYHFRNGVMVGFKIPLN